MKVLLLGAHLEKIIPAINDAGLELVEQNPDVVITYGGDGALLGAERNFPGIPKFPIRDSETAPLCPIHASYRKQLNELLSGKLETRELIKLAGTCKNKHLIAINDIFIHNANPVSAIRYQVLIDGEAYGHEVVGDGVGVSTPHGSTAYYRSITHSTFRAGIGLAFSNSTEVTNHLVLPQNTEIRIKLTRGPAVFVADNNPAIHSVAEGDEVIIRCIEETVQVIGHNIFMCSRCLNLRHPRG